MNAKKRKLERMKELIPPIVCYSLPSKHKFPKILSMLDSGNVRLYCQENGLDITTPVLYPSGAFFIHCPYHLHGKNKTTCQIVIDRDALIEAFQKVSVSLTSQNVVDAGHSDCASLVTMGIFEENYLSLTSFDQQGKECKNVQVCFCDDKEVEKMIDIGKEIDFQDSLKLNAKFILGRLPGGKEVTWEVEANRLTFLSKTVQTTARGFIPGIFKSTYKEEFGELATALIVKLLKLFGDHDIQIQMEDKGPLCIEGWIEGSNESILLYLAGKAKDDDAEEDEPT
jgi:hypothetical protein